jgi:hypothetical protein
MTLEGGSAPCLPRGRAETRRSSGLRWNVIPRNATEVSHRAGIASGCEAKTRTPPVAGGAR